MTTATTKDLTTANISSINSAIEALECARLNWCLEGTIYAGLGVSLRKLRATKAKAERALAAKAKAADKQNHVEELFGAARACSSK